MPEIIMGARGWHHAHWLGTFYPEDLPQEWWFSYYSNEFRSVLVPWEYLQRIDPRLVQEWIDDTDEGFTFYVEVELHSPWEELFQRIKPLAPQLGGIYLRNCKQNSTELYDLGVVEEVIGRGCEMAPMVVAWNDLDEKLQAAAERYGLGCYWQPENRSINQCRGTLAIAEICQSARHDPKSIKKIIEHCCSVQGPTTIGLFFGGETPRLEDLRTATLIWQMMA